MSVMKKGLSLLFSAAVMTGISGCNNNDAEKTAEPAAVAAQPAASALQSDLQKFSYSVGMMFAKDMQRKGVSELDEAAFGSAVRDVLDEKPLQLTEEEMIAAVEKATDKMMTERAAKAKAEADQAKLAGEKFLAENGAKEGVITLPSGIQYKILTAGEGEKPTAESTIVAHYEGTLIDGSVFDSSYERGTPVTFALNRVIPGWQEVVAMMPVGSKWQVVIPSELAYGEAGSPPKIAGNSTLRFDIELIEIKK